MKENDIFISVIVPCYNVQDYVKDCLLSLRSVNEKNVEFIIVNDGSKDLTLEIINETIKGDDRFILINQKNKGVSSARNAALQKVRGKYVYLLDGDDCLIKNTLKLIYDYLSKNSSDLLISSLFIRNSLGEFKRGHGIPFGVYSISDLFRSIRCFPTLHKLVYRTEIIRNRGIKFNEEIKAGEVYSFTVNFMKYANSVLVISEPSFYYIVRESSAVHSVNFDSDMSVLNALNDIYMNGDNLSNEISFHITAFKLVTSFTYTKYVKNKVFNSNALLVVKKILSDKIFRTCLMNVAFRRHSCYCERFLALYILLFSVSGFKFLRYFNVLRVKL